MTTALFTTELTPHVTPTLAATARQGFGDRPWG
jgi:hypothetical protein